VGVIGERGGVKVNEWLRVGEVERRFGFGFGFGG